MDVFCLFGVSSCHFGKTPESVGEILIRHLRLVYLGEVFTRSKEIGPVVEHQEEQQFTDGSDGPSKFTDPAVSPPTELLIGHFEVYI